MAVQRSLHLGSVGRIAAQNLIVGDQALGTLRQKDLVAELHRLAMLAPFDQVGGGRAWGPLDRAESKNGK